MKFNTRKQEALCLASLRERLHYDPETGIFTWKIIRSLRSVGKEAGNHSAAGYRFIWLKEGQFQTHRLAWFYVYGEWPDGEIDHINYVRDDNRIANLRVATPRQNLAHRPATGGRKLKGITRHPDQKRWIAQIRDGGKNVNLGSFATAEEAHAVYVARSIQVHGEFAWVK